MEEGQLKVFKKWLTDYIADFYGDDEYVNANIKLKEDHSLRVCKEADYLCRSLGLDENKRRIALVTALFHDLGRFRQFVKWRTYSDIKSESHAELALDVISQTGILNGIAADERSLIVEAIKYHGVKQLPPHLEGERLMFAKLIRDADKLDIFYVVIKYYKEYAENPAGFKLEVELPDKAGYSDAVADGILAGSRIDYEKLVVWNDMKLLQLGWMYDVNFAATLRRIREKGYLEQILEYLPADEKVNRIKEKIFEYVDKRIENRQDLI